MAEETPKYLTPQVVQDPSTLRRTTYKLMLKCDGVNDLYYDLPVGELVRCLVDDLGFRFTNSPDIKLVTFMIGLINFQVDGDRERTHIFCLSENLLILGLLRDGAIKYWIQRKCHPPTRFAMKLQLTCLQSASKNIDLLKMLAALMLADECFREEFDRWWDSAFKKTLVAMDHGMKQCYESVIVVF